MVKQIDKARLNVAAIVKELTDDEITALLAALIDEGRRRNQDGDR